MKRIFRVGHVTLQEFKMDANMAAEARNNALCRKPVVVSEIPMDILPLSAMPESLVTLPTLPDVGQLPEFKMADCKPEVHCISGME